MCFDRGSLDFLGKDKLITTYKTLKSVSNSFQALYRQMSKRDKLSTNIKNNSQPIDQDFISHMQILYQRQINWQELYEIPYQPFLIVNYSKLTIFKGQPINQFYISHSLVKALELIQLFSVVVGLKVYQSGKTNKLRIGTNSYPSLNSRSQLGQNDQNIGTRLRYIAYCMLVKFQANFRIGFSVLRQRISKICLNIDFTTNSQSYLSIFLICIHLIIWQKYSYFTIYLAKTFKTKFLQDNCLK